MPTHSEEQPQDSTGELAIYPKKLFTWIMGGQASASRKKQIIEIQHRFEASIIHNINQKNNHAKTNQKTSVRNA